MSANAETLRQIIDSGEFIVAPGVFEMISARVADEMGFKALYMTGYGATASYLGLPDAGLATYSEMVDCAGRIARGTSTPLIARTVSPARVREPGPCMPVGGPRTGSRFVWYAGKVHLP